MRFLIREMGKSILPVKKKKRIGFIVPAIGLYSRVDASTRIRVYDVINAFRNDEVFHLELYRSFRNYDVVCFLKTYDEKAYNLAEKLQASGTKVIFDININIFEPNSHFVSKQQLEDGKRFTALSDIIITNSVYTKKILNEQFPDKPISLIREAIHDDYFNASTERNPGVPELIWIGYKHKAEALYLIKDVLSELIEEYPFKIRVISQEDPQFDFGKIPVIYSKYRHGTVVNFLSKATAFLAPRDLSDSYNRGHSFTKIGIAMAAEVPVIASPLPAYVESPALICNTKEEWRNELTRILKGKIGLDELKKKGKEYCNDYYSIEKVKLDYQKLFLNIGSKLKQV